MAAGQWELRISAVLVKFGVTKEKLQENAAEELESTLQDYHDLAAQYSDMMTAFCYEDRPVRRNNVWLCSKCGKRVQYNHTHCHWCGKKMGWDGSQRKGGKVRCRR